MNKVYIMMGLPGSGKSTFLKNYIKPLCNINIAKIVSRDEIRFSLLKEGEDYFSHEEEVKKIFWETINNALIDGYNVFVDQTSLNKASRKLLLNHIYKNIDINIIFVDTPCFNCIENNDTRIGTKAFVPKGVIRRMSCQLEPPTYDEGFKNIYTYNIYTDEIIRLPEEEVIAWQKELKGN